MAAHKLNVLHQHLTDDAGWRFEVPAYPKLVTVGARGDEDTPGAGTPRYLSKRDIRELVDHARLRYVEIVPEIELPTRPGLSSRKCSPKRRASSLRRSCTLAATSSPVIAGISCRKCSGCVRKPGSRPSAKSKATLITRWPN